MTSTTEIKQVLRRQMRTARRSLLDQDLLSEAIWANVEPLTVVRSAQVLMVFDSIAGEPMTPSFMSRRRVAGQRVVCPEDMPRVDPGEIDVVLVPGLAFTRACERLGQGGGWYDRFLPTLTPGCVTIGVCFAAQILEDLPTEAHDVTLEMVVTESEVYRASCKRRL